MRSEHRFVALMGLLLAASGCAAQDEAPQSTRPGFSDVASFEATGEPRRCLPLRNTNLTPAGQNHVMARTGANSYFRNELRAACPALEQGRTIVLRANTGQICDMDVFEVIDPVSRISFGICSLGMFTPVTVPKGSRW